MTVAGWVAAAALIGVGAVAAPTVTAKVVQRPGPASGQTVIAVKLEASDLVLGAYQGTFKFAPGAFTIVSASTPTGDGTRVVNPADSAKGIVRFAGFTLSGFKSEEVFTLVIRSLRPLATAAIVAELQVAADLNGVAVPKERLVAGRGFSPEIRRN